VRVPIVEAFSINRCKRSAQRGYQGCKPRNPDIERKIEPTGAGPSQVCSPARGTRDQPECVEIANLKIGHRWSAASAAISSGHDESPADQAALKRASRGGLLAGSGSPQRTGFAWNFYSCPFERRLKGRRACRVLQRGACACHLKGAELGSVAIRSSSPESSPRIPPHQDSCPLKRIFVGIRSLSRESPRTRLAAQRLKQPLIRRCARTPMASFRVGELAKTPSEEIDPLVSYLLSGSPDSSQTAEASA